MLLFKGPRDQILHPLQAVSGIVEKRQTMPILSHVLLQIEAGRLVLLTSDIDIQIRTETQTDSQENTALTVPARKLQDILKSLPETAVVTLELEDKRLQLRAGRSRYHLQTLSAEDYPLMNQPDDVGSELKLSQRQFRRLLSRVQYAMAQQDIRYYLNGLLLTVDNQQICVVATDGHRLAFASEALETDETRKRIEVILPRKTVLELSRQLQDSNETLKISVAPSQAKFHIGTVELTTKLIDGKFPDYERVIPQHHDKIFLIESTPLIQALQRTTILITEKLRGVRLLLTSGNLKIIARNTEHEEAQEDLEIEYDGEALDVSFNVSYLLDMLQNISTERIKVHLLDTHSSGLFTLPDNDSFKYIVMPMRL